jgi:hypothetical protein
MDTLPSADQARLEAKIDAIYASVEKTRRYFLWTLIATIVAFVLPLIGAAFLAPAFLSSYTGQLEQLEGLAQ